MIPAQQQSIPSHGQQQSQMTVPQQQPNSQPQGSDTRQIDNRSPKGFIKGDMKVGGRGSPHGSYTYYFGGQHGMGRQPQHRAGLSSPDRAEHHPQQPSGEARFSSQQAIGSSDMSPQRGSPQGQANHPQGQPQSHQGPFHGRSPQRNPEGGPQHEDQYPHAKGGEVVGPVYQQQVTSQPAHHHHHPSPQQGPSPTQQQELPPQGLPEGQYQQGPPQQGQQFPPGGQYLWAQYPQPSSGNGSFPSGPSAFGNEPEPYSNGPGPFTGPGGPNVSSSYSIGGPSGSPYQSGISGPDSYPDGPIEEREPVFPDKKADPG